MKEKQHKIKNLDNKDITATRAFLERFKSSSLFLLSNMAHAGIQDGHHRCQGYWLGAFLDETLVAVATHFWNDNILIQSPDLSLIPTLLDELLARSNRPLCGLLGPWPQLEVAVEHLDVDLSRCSYASKEPLFELPLDELILPMNTASTRCATPRDAHTIASWLQRAEALLQPFPHPLSYHLANAHRLIEERHVWLATDPAHDHPCSMTNVNAALPDARIFQIGGVFTPEEERARGFARQAVACQLLDMQRRGYTHAILFTGQDNIPARRAYQALGFRHILDYGLILGIPQGTLS